MGSVLSLIHISEPTRRYAISYAVFCLKKKIFVTRRLLKENEEKLQNLFEVNLNKDDKIYKPQEIIDGSKNYDGILSSVTDPINADTISKLSSSIKIIANGAVGFGNIDIQAAKAKGITVTNTPDVLTDATADIQILLLLGASRSCLLYTSPSPRDATLSRMPSSA